MMGLTSGTRFRDIEVHGAPQQVDGALGAKHGAERPNATHRAPRRAEDIQTWRKSAINP